MLKLNDYVKDLSDLISLNSIERKPAEQAPFGEAVLCALNKFCSIAKRLGFTPVNHNGYLAEIIVGEGEEVGVIGHLDVVPAGDLSAWNTHPFTLTYKNGAYYGRGVEDDKGPLLLCLYALKEVAESGIKFKRKIRFFAGTNEETGWKDVAYYSKIGKFPEYGFSPDGTFPLSYAEKGVCQYKITIPSMQKFSNIKGGSVINAVCDYAEATPLFTPKQSDLDKFGLYFENGKIVSHGKVAHGSTPHLGKNAILPLLEYAEFCGENVSEVINCLFRNGLNLYKMSNEQGSVTISPDLIYCLKNKIVIECDVRIPYPITAKDVEEKIKSTSLNYSFQEKHPPVCTDKNGWFVNSLLSAYVCVTNDKTAAPISMGGSTFARAFKYGCSFGPSFPNSCSTAHQSNEHVTVKQLNDMFEIYKQAFINLVK